ncbi:hypothetical protein QC764_302920 [Podospora pseudoanserina]|uniref:Ubiquitin 3 binding protein But2 C-terminal domain-containing protein n=2 Tax=Podospora TaxID=5144 RepID=A0ABR0ICJ2_9PEZI|nr:hypothetical protein QC764_302920 [Podospora pseudoanserina]
MEGREGITSQRPLLRPSRRYRNGLDVHRHSSSQHKYKAHLLRQHSSSSSPSPPAQNHLQESSSRPDPFTIAKMKYTTASALLLQATTALAGPIIEARQQPRAVFTRVATQTGQGCEGSFIFYDDANQIATVTYPNYGVTLPSGPREESCTTTLQVSFPVGQCTAGTALGTTTGTVYLPSNGITAFFTARDYAIQPTIGAITDVSPNGQWTGARSAEPYVLRDSISYRLTPPNPQNSLVNFTVFGDLSLQPENAGGGSLTAEQFVFDIRNQSACKFDFNHGVVKKRQ